MLILLVVAYILLIFPFFLSVNVFFSLEFKKLYFSIELFGILVLGGYVEQIKEGFAIHLTKNYAIIIPYKKMVELRTNVNPLKDYPFINFFAEIDIGDENDLLNATLIAFLINYIFNHVEFYLKNKKSYVNFNNSVNVYNDRNALNLSINIGVFFNLLMILLSLIKIGVGKIINAIRNKKRQNQQGC